MKIFVHTTTSMFSILLTVIVIISASVSIAGDDTNTLLGRLRALGSEYKEYVAGELPDDKQVAVLADVVSTSDLKSFPQGAGGGIVSVPLQDSDRKEVSKETKKLINSLLPRGVRIESKAGYILLIHMSSGDSVQFDSQENKGVASSFLIE